MLGSAQVWTPDQRRTWTLSSLGQRLGLLFVCVCAGASCSPVTKLPGNPTTHASKTSKSCFSVENKWTKPSYLPPENVLWGGVVAGSLGLAVTTSFCRSLERADVNKGSVGRWCVDHGWL